MEVLIVLAALVALSLGATTTNSHVLAEFAAKGIDVYSKGGCYDKHNRTCTSFDGLQFVSLNGILDFSRTSGCHITILHGTESGHRPGAYSHGTGFKLDVNDTSCVTTYVTGHFKPLGLSSDGSKLYSDNHGNVFEHESDHFDTT